MKKTLIMILILMLSVSAFASTCDVYIPANGRTYHAVHHVDEEGSWVEIIDDHPEMPFFDHTAVASDEAVAFDLAKTATLNEHIASCPYMNNGGAKTVSAKTSSEKKPQAISRGGTIVVRVPWSWINGQQLTGSWWGSIDHAVGETKEQVLFPVMPPSDVAEWVLQGSMSEELIRIFAVAKAESKAMVMNRRPLDDNYYVVIRPEKKFGSSFDLYYSVSEWGMTMNDDLVHGDLQLDQETQVINLKIDSMDGMKASWTGNYDGFKISLFEVDGVYIAVITEKNVKEEDLKYTQLYIDAPGYDFDYFYVQMEGYTDNGNGIYCCVLSESEAELMMDDVSVRLEHDHSKW